MWSHSILNNLNIYNIAINSEKNNNIFLILVFKQIILIE